MLPPAKAPEEAAKAPKTVWETVLTTTPVVLTVLATTLAGLSSSEMTRAQYYRAMAAQYQSKATDQWSFFQAKRVRGTVLEESLAASPGRPNRIDGAGLSATVQGIAGLLRTGEEQAGRMRKTVESLDVRPAPIGEAAANLQTVAAAKAEEASQALGEVHARLDQDSVHKALAALGSEDLSLGQAEKRTDDPAVRAALKALEERRPDSDLVPLVLPISEGQIRQAVETAEANIKAFDDANHWIDKELKPLDAGVGKFEALATAFHRAVEEMRDAGDEVTRTTPGQAELRDGIDSLARTDTSLQRRLAGLRDYTAARKEFTARRYRREADYDLQAAWPYELQVAKSGVDSERHRLRSQRFFFAMLAAQAGTAIASLALAARQRSALWTLAGLAGLTALAFSVYVYFFV